MSNEWYTPSKYIEAARSVMGSIDLDPASCSLANKTVQATTYYTKEQDGLTLPWYGNVWLNPPYGKLGKLSGMTLFTNRVIQAYENKEIKQALVATLTGMYARWFFNLLKYNVCFLEQKPHFTYDDGSIIQHPYAACIFYLGPNEQTFQHIFLQFGHVKLAERVFV